MHFPNALSDRLIDFASSSVCPSLPSKSKLVWGWKDKAHEMIDTSPKQFTRIHNVLFSCKNTTMTSTVFYKHTKVAVSNLAGVRLAE